jgi:hypothetical protein
MKNILALGLLLGSLAASAQSYLVLNNGVMLTTDRAGYLYDFGHFVVPYEVKVNGGQFLVEKDQLITVDENGYKYDKDQEVDKVKGKGLNYLVTDKNEIITIDMKGFFYKYDKDDAIKRIQKFGGNFFVTQEKRTSLLYTVNGNGNYFNMAIPELNPSEISIVGGTYFMTNRGVYFTVSKDGYVYSKKDVRAGAAKKLGGNFFIDNMNRLFTVSEAGVLANPVLPVNLILNAIVKTGANYMIDNQGKLFAVDNNGNVFERSVKSHDLRNTKIISL